MGKWKVSGVGCECRRVRVGIVVGGDELAGLRAHRAFCVDEDSVDVSSALVGKETSSQLVLDGHRDALLRDKVIRANYAVPVVIPGNEKSCELNSQM